MPPCFSPSTSQSWECMAAYTPGAAGLRQPRGSGEGGEAAKAAGRSDGGGGLQAAAARRWQRQCRSEAQAHPCGSVPDPRSRWRPAQRLARAGSARRTPRRPVRRPSVSAASWARCRHAGTIGASGACAQGREQDWAPARVLQAAKPGRWVSAIAISHRGRTSGHGAARAGLGCCSGPGGRSGSVAARDTCVPYSTCPHSNAGGKHAIVGGFSCWLYMPTCKSGRRSAGRREATAAHGGWRASGASQPRGQLAALLLCMIGSRKSISTGQSVQAGGHPICCRRRAAGAAASAAAGCLQAGRCGRSPVPWGAAACNSMNLHGVPMAPIKALSCVSVALRHVRVASRRRHWHTPHERQPPCD